MPTAGRLICNQNVRVRLPHCPLISIIEREIFGNLNYFSYLCTNSLAMKLQAVTVSVNYSDFLKYTIVENKDLFDKWIIVTDTKDAKTKELCDEYGITCIQTDVFYENGAKFNKYAAINEGLKYVDDDAWILFIDSDIVLHYEMRRTLEKIGLRKDCLYGMDRLNCSGYKNWKKYISGRGMLMENWLLHTAGLDLGPRLVHHYGMSGENGRFEGWRPLGYFQLAHRSAFTSYPQDSKTADHCDLLFSRLWDRQHRIFIPELYCIHIESYGAGKAINWNGRRSRPFEEEPIIPVEEKPKEEVIIIEEKKHREEFYMIKAFRLIYRYLRRYCKFCKHHYYGDL